MIKRSRGKKHRPIFKRAERMKKNTNSPRPRSAMNTAVDSIILHLTSNTNWAIRTDFESTLLLVFQTGHHGESFEAAVAVSFFGYWSEGLTDDCRLQCESFWIPRLDSLGRVDSLFTFTRGWIIMRKEEVVSFTNSSRRKRKVWKVPPHRAPSNLTLVACDVCLLLYVMSRSRLSLERMREKFSVTLHNSENILSS